MIDTEFIFYENDWLRKKFEADWEFIRSGKYHSFKLALTIFLINKGKRIVETGTLRMHNDPGGGSTMFFGAFCKKYDAKLTTVDNNPIHMKTSMTETIDYKDYIEYVVYDSISYLSINSSSLDLLFLDSMDCPSTGDATESQTHQLNEFRAAEKLLHTGSVLLLDDSNFPNGGKTRLLKAYLSKLPEWECIMDHAQSLWIKTKMDSLSLCPRKIGKERALRPLGGRF